MTRSRALTCTCTGQLGSCRHVMRRCYFGTIVLKHDPHTHMDKLHPLLTAWGHSCKFRSKHGTLPWGEEHHAMTDITQQNVQHAWAHGYPGVVKTWYHADLSMHNMRCGLVDNIALQTCSFLLITN